MRFALNFSRLSPSSPTPASRIALALASTTRRRAAARLASLPPSTAIASPPSADEEERRASSAARASYTACDCEILVVAATTLGCIAACASRSFSEFLTPLRCDTTPHAYASGAVAFSTASTAPAYDGSIDDSSAARSVSKSSSSFETPGTTWDSSMTANFGRPAWSRRPFVSGVTSVASGTAVAIGRVESLRRLVRESERARGLRDW
mmetsp:Transcript_26092/g.104403  ORF Transcript_26092/g.104403 Transcript_26092/m.104403 type:complete len:208 (-) Transcript_26092:114-737(-)